MFFGTFSPHLLRVGLAGGEGVPAGSSVYRYQMWCPPACGVRSLLHQGSEYLMKHIVVMGVAFLRGRRKAKKKPDETLLLVMNEMVMQSIAE